MDTSKKKKTKDFEPKKYFENIAQARVVVPSRDSWLCPEAVKQLNESLSRECALKKHQIDSERPCMSSSGDTQPVDLIVLIDTSGSMSDEANDLSDAADAAIKDAEKKCPSKLRVEWFGVETVGVGKFTQNHRDYLLGKGIPASSLSSIAGNPEEGGPAMYDLSQYFDWRPGASRAIFYLGDEPLKQGLPYNSDDAEWRDKVIEMAVDQKVKVFTYAGTPWSTDTGFEFIDDFKKIANKTGGEFYQTPPSTVGGFQNMLAKIICATKTGGCSPVDLPIIQPCFKIKWGEGKKDNIETDDVEVMCITASNPYSNVTIKDLTVILVIPMDAQQGPIPMLPDGTPSVMVKPQFLVHFGDIPPCSVDTPDRLPSISREVVMMTRGAKEGKYKIGLAYCFTVEYTLANMDLFNFELV
ncbi:hypothetical protein KAU18_09770 [Candidatus Bathyarchaeota archaeon]|nr:hypothetical protein [Candidatus Bathyarchaeota archaeon]